MMSLFSTFQSGKSRFLALALFALLLIGASAIPHQVYADDPDCPEDVTTGSGSSYGHQLYKARMEYNKAAIAATQKAYREMQFKDTAPDDPKKSCIVKFLTTFDNLQSILMGIIHPIASAILAIVNQVLDFVCSAILTTINNLLASICLPVPQLAAPAFSLPTLSSESCDGISLGSFLSVTGGYTGYPGVLPFTALNNMSLIGNRPTTSITIPVF